MTSFINAFGLASVLTAMFALRYRFWRSPILLGAYFCFFFAMEWLVSAYYLPPDALGSEIGYVCLGLTAPMLGVIYGVNRYEQANGEDP